MILVGLSTTSSANNIDEIMKKQCQYLVYGTGENNIYINMYMMDIVAGEMYFTSKKKKFDYAHKTTSNQIKKRACKEALNNNTTKSFEDKYKFGMAMLIDKIQNCKITYSGDPEEN